MPLVPYKPDVEAWIAHFKDKTPRDPNAKWHPILPIKKKIEEGSPQQPSIKINMITPVQDALNRAKALLKKESKHFPWYKST